MIRILSVCAVTIALGACATAYQPQSFTGGYSEVQLNQDTFQISVKGNGYTSPERARNIALLRASDLALQNGFKRFVVAGGDVSERQTGVTPVTVNRIGSTLIATGGDPVVKPSGTIVVRMVREKDPEWPTALDADLIASQLRPQLAPK